MAYRIFDAVVIKVYINSGRLVIKSEKAGSSGKTGYLKTFVTVGPSVLITGKDNCSVGLSDIKAGNRVTIDFMKIVGMKPLVKGISILN